MFGCFNVGSQTVIMLERPKETENSRVSLHLRPPWATLGLFFVTLPRTRAEKGPQHHLHELLDVDRARPQQDRARFQEVPAFQRQLHL